MSLKQIKKIINTGSIYLANTHGMYDLDTDPVAWTVPENTIIFETQMIGDKCLTNIDEPLDELCTHRDVFSDYFFGIDTGYIALHSGDTYKAVFRNMVCYLPGDTIYNRTLTIGGGRGARKKYNEMGFYKYGLLWTKDAIALKLRDDLIEKEISISNQDFVNRILDNKGDEKYRIFIFSSCGSSDCSLEKKICRKRFDIIERHQTAQNLQLMELGINTGIGGSGYNKNNNNHAVYWNANNSASLNRRKTKRLKRSSSLASASQYRNSRK
jgi:hypothetical protein